MFRRWFYFSRFLEGLSEEQIEEIALYWRFPDPLPEPLPWGMSELDRLDRKSLVQRWEESERQTSRIMRETSEHTEDEYKFYVRHVHWPGSREDSALHSATIIRLDSVFAHDDGLPCRRIGTTAQTVGAMQAIVRIRARRDFERNGLP